MWSSMPARRRGSPWSWPTGSWSPSRTPAYGTHHVSDERTPPPRRAGDLLSSPASPMPWATREGSTDRPCGSRSHWTARPPEDAGTAPWEGGRSCLAVVRSADVVKPGPPGSDNPWRHEVARVVTGVEPQVACSVPREQVIADGLVPVSWGDQGGECRPVRAADLNTRCRGPGAVAQVGEQQTSSVAGQHISPPVARDVAGTSDGESGETGADLDTRSTHRVAGVGVDPQDSGGVECEQVRPTARDHVTRSGDRGEGVPAGAEAAPGAETTGAVARVQPQSACG